jgi:TPR repeat protein
VGQNYPEAVKWYRLAAAQGQATAQVELGLWYVTGKGVLQDYAGAVKWFRLAAAQGNAIAQNNLGVAYEHGNGVAQGYVRAHMWYNLGAVSGKAEKAAKNRDNLAAKMTPAQIAEAQKLARECQARYFKSC